MSKLKSPLKRKIHEVIFEADTFYGKLYDILLLITICISIAVVMLESIPSFYKEHNTLLKSIEWVVVILFTIEYVLRIFCIDKPIKYIFSFYGLIDLISFLPTYILRILNPSIIVNELELARIIRLLRVFRIFKLGRYIESSNILIQSIKESRGKIVVFLSGMVILAVLVGSLMYVVENHQNGFESIPKSIYWAIVTMTTVGYGDITPQTPIGQFISSFIMIIGYGIIAIPAGIFAVSIRKSEKTKKRYNTQSCPSCSYDRHDGNAKFCKKCGSLLNE